MGPPRCPGCKTKNVEGYKFCSECGMKSDESSKGTTTVYHFVVMGSGGVGKSAITIRFVNRQFESKYDPTIEDRYQKVVDHNNIPCVLEILDTAGQETFSAMRELYMKNGEGFVLVYSVTSMKSLDDLDPIRNGIVRHKQASDVPMIVVGNKCDMIKKREVELKDAKEITKNYGCPLLESSAKNDININEIFYNLIDQVAAKKGVDVTSKPRHGTCLLI